MKHDHIAIETKDYQSAIWSFVGKGKKVGCWYCSECLGKFDLPIKPVYVEKKETTKQSS